MWLPPTSPHTAPATKSITIPYLTKISRKHLQHHLQRATDPTMIRECNRHPQPASQPRLPFTPTARILYCKLQHFALRLSFHTSPNAAPATKSDTSTSPNILRLPHKMILMIDMRHRWNVIYNARSNRCHPATSPNTALATHTDCHDCHRWNAIYNARNNMWLPPTSPHTAPATKSITIPYLTKISRKHLQHHFQRATDPTMIREWNRHPQPASQPRLLFTPAARSLSWKLQHLALRLSFHISPNTAPATKSDTSTSPNTAPATQNASNDWYASQMQRYLQCAKQQVSSCNITKYCACHAHWLSWLIIVTDETLFTMRETTCGFFQPHHILRLSHKMTLMICLSLCLDPTITWLFYDLTLWLSWFTWLCDLTLKSLWLYDWTVLLLDCVTWLYYHLTLWFYSTIA